MSCALRATGMASTTGSRVAGVRVADARVADARRDGDGFSEVTDDGEQVRARRVLVTTGLTDEHPDVPGLAERWGHDVLHCVYCHGWEVRDTAIGVLGSFHQALLFRQMSPDVTRFRHTGTELSDEQWGQLAGLGVAVADGEVTGLHIDNEDRLAGVRLVSGNLVPVRNLVVAPRFVARAGFLGGLGLSVIAHPSGAGEQVRVDPAGFTGVEGVWAAGNVADVFAGVSAAAAAAAMHTDLLMVDAKVAAAARTVDAGPFSGAMEAEVSRWVLACARFRRRPGSLNRPPADRAAAGKGQVVRALRWARSPWCPNSTSSSTVWSSSGPSQCGTCVSNSAASPALRTRV